MVFLTSEKIWNSSQMPAVGECLNRKDERQHKVCWHGNKWSMNCTVKMTCWLSRMVRYLYNNRWIQGIFNEAPLSFYVQKQDYSTYPYTTHFVFFKGNCVCSKQTLIEQTVLNSHKLSLFNTESKNKKRPSNEDLFFNYMARPTGFEPTTFASGEGFIS